MAWGGGDASPLCYVTPAIIASHPLPSPCTQCREPSSRSEPECSSVRWQALLVQNRAWLNKHANSPIIYMSSTCPYPSSVLRLMAGLGQSWRRPDRVLASQKVCNLGSPCSYRFSAPMGLWSWVLMAPGEKLGVVWVPSPAIISLSSLTMCRWALVRQPSACNALL